MTQRTGTRVVWPRQRVVELMSFEIASPADDEVVIQTECTLISPGTERAFLLGLPNTPNSFPAYPGYSNVGRVLQVGSAVRGIGAGARVISQAGHASHAVISAREVLTIDDDALAAETAVFFNLASISLQGIRKSRLEIGEPVLIMGLGLVGLLAVEFARLGGAFPVVACDPVASRCRLAERVGADAALDPRGEGFHREIDSLTRGSGPAVVIDATGSPEAVVEAFRLAGRHARVVLLASTRGPAEGVDFYSDVHKKGLTIVGAHNFVRPQEDSSAGYWTAHDDWRLVLSLLAAGRIDVSPFISHRAQAPEAGAMYRMLMEWSPDLLGVILTW